MWGAAVAWQALMRDICSCRAIAAKNDTSWRCQGAAAVSDVRIGALILGSCTANDFVTLAGL